MINYKALAAVALDIDTVRQRDAEVILFARGLLRLPVFDWAHESARQGLIRQPVWELSTTFAGSEPPLWRDTTWAAHNLLTDQPTAPFVLNNEAELALVLVDFIAFGRPLTIVPLSVWRRVTAAAPDYFAGHTICLALGRPSADLVREVKPAAICASATVVGRLPTILMREIPALFMSAPDRDLTTWCLGLYYPVTIHDLSRSLTIPPYFGSRRFIEHRQPVYQLLRQLGLPRDMAALVVRWWVAAEQWARRIKAQSYDAVLAPEPRPAAATGLGLWLAGFLQF